MRFNRKKKAETTPKDPNAIEPTKTNSSKVIVNLKSGNAKVVTKEMLRRFKITPYDKTIYQMFDSKTEGRYYSEVLLPDINQGIIAVEFQPKFTILEKSEKQGVKHMAVTYSPDFKITYLISGKTIYLDVKGMDEPVFGIKRKMFDQAFPDFPPLVVIKWYQKRWMDIQEFVSIKKVENKTKKTKKLAEVKEA